MTTDRLHKGGKREIPDQPLSKRNQGACCIKFRGYITFSHGLMPF